MISDATFEQPGLTQLTPPLTPAEPTPHEPDNGLAMYQRTGQLTRILHDALRELGYDHWPLRLDPCPMRAIAWRISPR